MKAALKLTKASVVIVYYILSELKFPVSSLKNGLKVKIRKCTLIQPVEILLNIKYSLI